MRQNNASGVSKRKNLLVLDGISPSHPLYIYFWLMHISLFVQPYVCRFIFGQTLGDATEWTKSRRGKKWQQRLRRTVVQKSLILTLIIHFPTSSGVSEQENERSGACERESKVKRVWRSKQMSSVSKQANGWLLIKWPSRGRFMAVLNHSAAVTVAKKKKSKR